MHVSDLASSSNASLVSGAPPGVATETVSIIILPSMMATIPIVYPHMVQEQAPSWGGGGYGMYRQVPRSFGSSMVLIVHGGHGTIGAGSETHVDNMV